MDEIGHLFEPLPFYRYEGEGWFQCTPPWEHPHFDGWDSINISTRGKTIKLSYRLSPDEDWISLGEIEEELIITPEMVGLTKGVHPVELKFWLYSDDPDDRPVIESTIARFSKPSK